MLSNISALFSSSVKLGDETTDGLRFYHDPFKSSFFALRKDNTHYLSCWYIYIYIYENAFTSIVDWDFFLILSFNIKLTVN